MQGSMEMNSWKPNFSFRSLLSRYHPFQFFWKHHATSHLPISPCFAEIWTHVIWFSQIFTLVSQTRQLHCIEVSLESSSTPISSVTSLFLVEWLGARRTSKKMCMMNLLARSNEMVKTSPWTWQPKDRDSCRYHGRFLWVRLKLHPYSWSCEGVAALDCSVRELGVSWYAAPFQASFHRVGDLSCIESGGHTASCDVLTPIFQDSLATRSTYS